MQMNPYLYFDGNCEEAFKFYERVLGAKILTMMTHEGTPAAEHVLQNGEVKLFMRGWPLASRC